MYAIKLNNAVIKKAVHIVDNAADAAISAAKIVDKSIEVKVSILPIDLHEKAFEDIFGTDRPENRINTYEKQIIDYISKGISGITFNLNFYIPRGIASTNNNLHLKARDYQNKFTEIIKIAENFRVNLDQGRLDQNIILDSQVRGTVHIYDLKWNSVIQINPYKTIFADSKSSFSTSYNFEETVTTILKLNTGFRGVGFTDKARLHINSNVLRR